MVNTLSYFLFPLIRVDSYMELPSFIGSDYLFNYIVLILKVFL